MISTYISDPTVGFIHLCEVFDAVAVHPQWQPYYPNPDFVTTFDEEAYDRFLDEVADDMNDEDGCQEWRKGLCTCEDCSEFARESDLDHQIHRPDDDFADMPTEANDYAFEDNEEYEDDSRDIKFEDDDMDYLGLEAAIRDCQPCTCGWSDCSTCGRS